MLETKTDRIMVLIEPSLKKEFSEKCNLVPMSAIIRNFVEDFVEGNSDQQKLTAYSRLLGRVIEAFRLSNGVLMEKVIKEAKEALYSV